MNQDHLNKDGLWTKSPHSITTATGLRVDPQDLHPEDVSIYDIARALSRQCRYNGHVGGFLSVARHSIWVSEMLPNRLKRAGLLHDAAEAYLGDLVRPLKASDFGKAYLEIEECAERVIFRTLGIPFPLDPLVKQADTDVLMQIELGDFHARDSWNTTPTQDEIEFLGVYDQLTYGIPWHR